MAWGGWIEEVRKELVLLEQVAASSVLKKSTFLLSSAWAEVQHLLAHQMRGGNDIELSTYK